MIKDEILQALLPLSTLSLNTRQAIARRAFTHKFSEGRNLVIEGAPAEFGYFLISGLVRVLRIGEDGRVQVLGRFGQGAPLNIISLLAEDRVNRASIEALTAVDTLVLSADDFDHLLHHCLDFSNLLLQIFAQRIAGITDLAASLSLNSVRARLAQFLMELANLPDTTNGWTQDEIAAHIGTVRDVVGRILRDFEAQGLIRRDRQHITLLNRPGLETIAGQGEP